MSPAGEEDHAPKKAKIHVYRPAPSRCPLNTEALETQRRSRWACLSSEDDRYLARNWKFPLKKLLLDFLDPPEDPTEDGVVEGEEEEAEDDDTVVDEDESAARETVMKVNKGKEEGFIYFCWPQRS